MELTSRRGDRHGLGPNVDLNVDLDEGFGRWSLSGDDALLEVITSPNVAGGFHVGDPTIMRRVCRSARERSVAAGAQVSYRDLAVPELRAADLAAQCRFGQSVTFTLIRPRIHLSALRAARAGNDQDPSTST